MDYDLAVVGAGIVGVSAALWAARRGHRVVLIDPSPPGSGTSSGNACTIATYGCLPVNDPSVLTGLPGLMFAPGSPLRVDVAYALRHPGWMLRFLANCRAEPSARIAAQLAMILSHADGGLNPLIADAGAEDLIAARGQLSVWSTKAAAGKASAGIARRAELGVELVELSPEEAREIEPGLAMRIARAVYFPDARQVSDPQALITRFHHRFTELRGTTLAHRVLRVEPMSDGVIVHTVPAELTAKRVVITAGAFSNTISGSGADRLPLGVERGYHLMFAEEAARVTRPVGWAEGGFYAVPTAQGLRLAGTVEIAARDAPPREDRLRYLHRRGQDMLGPLPPATSTWLGHRPTMPDSLPVIGYAPGTDRVIHAFGHQHLGLTLGGITGRIVTDLTEGRMPNMDISAFAPDRAFA